MNERRLFIFSEGGNGIGLGHFARCSALYEEARKQGMNVVFVANEAAQGLGILANKKVRFSDWHSMDVVKGIDIKDSYCVVDSYLANADVYKYISEQSKRTLFFDDENRLVYPNGILINPHVTRKYQNIESLVGLKYALVREPFIRVRKAATRAKIKKIMVSLGADLHGIKAKVVTALKQFFGEIEIVTPSGLRDVEMANLIAECDVGVIPASQTAIEFCSVGTPFVCIKTASNQNLTWLVENNIIDGEVFHDDKNIEEKILEQIKGLLSYEVRERKKLLLQAVIPEDGAKRIIERLTK